MPFVVRHRPVEVLARAVDSREGLLVQEELQAIAAGHALHGFHDKHVVVGGDVGVLEDRRDFVLRRGDFVVPGFDRNAELVKLKFGFHHAGENPLGDRAEVVVFHFLTLRRLGTEEGPAGVEQVGTLEIEVLVDQEVFLLGTAGRGDALGLRSEELQHADRLLREGVHRAEQGGLLVEGLAGPRAEGRRDAESGAVGVVEDEGGAGGVPGRVTSGLEGGADAARGEAGGVGLAADEFAAGEFGDRGAGIGRNQERVVLLGGQAGHRLEPVGVVRGTTFQGPFLHGGGDDVGNARIERSALLDRFAQSLVHVLGEPRPHHFVGEYVHPVKLTDRAVLRGNPKVAAIGLPRRDRGHGAMA